MTSLPGKILLATDGSEVAAEAAGELAGAPAPSCTSCMRRDFVPASTEAAIATTKALPEMRALRRRRGARHRRGRFGLGPRLPARPGDDRGGGQPALREEAASERYREILGVTEGPLVSGDIVGDPRASVVQLDMTRVVGGALAKVMYWYDNEWDFTNQMVRQALQEPGLQGAPAGVATP